MNLDSHFFSAIQGQSCLYLHQYYKSLSCYCPSQHLMLYHWSSLIYSSYDSVNGNSTTKRRWLVCKPINLRIYFDIKILILLIQTQIINRKLRMIHDCNYKVFCRSYAWNYVTLFFIKWRRMQAISLQYLYCSCALHGRYSTNKILIVLYCIY